MAIGRLFKFAIELGVCRPDCGSIQSGPERIFAVSIYARYSYALNLPDLHSSSLSIIMRVYRLEFGIRLPRLAQARRARSPQIAQALGALAAVHVASLPQD